MNLKGIGLLVAFIFSAVILSCNEETYPTEIPYFTVNGIGNNVINNKTKQQITSSNPTVWNEVAYRIGFQIKGIAQSEYSPNGTLLAFGCPPVGYLGSKIGILELEIISNSNYSSLIEVGESASRLFGVEVLGELQSIEEFNLIFRENYNFKDFKLVLLRAPEEGGELQSFSIRIKFVGGTSFETTTNQIRIVK
jgi:hypothetical protein